MRIVPTQATIGSLLEITGTFEVPKYQRNYGWREEEIAAFLNDLDLCVAARAKGTPRHHFFGGVVTAKAVVPGSSRQHQELVDGQQRLATFLMLIAQLKATLRSTSVSLDTSETEHIRFLLETADLLESRFESQRDQINLQWSQVPRLTLSLPDQPYFEGMLGGAAPVQERASHGLLKSAFDTIGGHLAAAVEAAPDVTAKVTFLADVLKILEEDWTVIHMAAQERADAHMLFQVLNDRGKSLTEGELLRALTLEALAPVGTAGENQLMERQWDDVLSGKDIDVRQGLIWAYASQIGTLPGKATLLTDLQTGLFPMLLTPPPLTRGQADTLTAAVSSLATDFSRLRTICRGDWPLADHPAVTAWNRDRLRLLIVHLKQYECLPFLIAATLLKPAIFVDLVESLERFCFRYTVMCEGPRSHATEVLNAQAVEIRRDPEQYKTGPLKAELHALSELHATDAAFSERIGALRYSRVESNKPLKYFLLTLENYVRWYDEGAQGRPVCRDRMRVLDFENATIEHIYPENADDIDAVLAPYLNTLGNLTILSPEENDRAGAKTFTAKLPYFKDSHSTLNKQIGENPAWTTQQIDQRHARLVAMGLAIFRV